MRYRLTIYDKEHVRGKLDDADFATETRAINDAKRFTRNGIAFKVEIWRTIDGDRIDTLPVRVYFGAVADGLREHVERVDVRPFSVERR